jgi:pimeloyl-ACP methyl ester carboxylesterase
MAAGRTEQRVKLKDGRTLGYAQFGADEGIPIFYFHGFPGSRLEWQLFGAEKYLEELSACIIAVDRPGYGLSEFKRRRTIRDWPADVVELADTLEIDRFAVLGISGGGPYAAVCATMIPERLTRVGIVCGMGPAGAPGMKAGVSWSIPGHSGLMRRLVLMLTALGLQKDPDKFLSRSKETLSEPDRRLLDQTHKGNAFVEGLSEALRAGTAGARLDAALYARPWGIRLEDITVETHLWHGGRDLNVPISVGRYVAELIPSCRGRFYENEGHLTLPDSHIREILGALVA